MAKLELDLEMTTENVYAIAETLEEYLKHGTNKDRFKIVAGALQNILHDYIHDSAEIDVLIEREIQRRIDARELKESE